MINVYLGLGTNIGDRTANLDRAIDGLRGELAVVSVSPIYETEAWGEVVQPNFLNMCTAVETNLEPLELLRYVKTLEIRLGRIPSERWGPRLIDIDILFYGSLIVQEPELIIPHVGIADRASVLVPLEDIAANLMHPILKLRISDLVEGVDTSGVWLYQPE